MLILTVNHRASASGVTAPDDNVLVYQPGPAGSFLINSYDQVTTASQVTLGLQDTKFNWAFISFDEPLTPISSSGDYDADGDVDGSDFLEWQRTLGATGEDLPADGSRNGVVDAADLALWQQNFGQGGDPPAPALSTPEPTALALLLMAAAPIYRRRAG
jgi:hypothetical protein